MKPNFNSFLKADPNDNGLNNAAILTFSRDVLDALIKELTQNSIDALVQKGSKLKLKIRMESINKDMIPNLENLDDILDKMITYWSRQEDFIKFFNNAKFILKQEKINILIFEDYNTKGLIGNCSEGTFKSLIVDEGVSDKDHKNALGGFGIGKNSFFAFTALQTVFYSSYNDLEGSKFMGVTKLAEYNDSFGRKKNNRIYYGEWKNDPPTNSSDLSHLSNQDIIPDFFRRNESGLSSFAIGVESSDKWQILVKQALIRNYWFLFENDLIEAEIDNEILNTSNYYDEANKLFIEDKSILSYIQTFRAPQIKIKEDIVHINSINILINEAAPGDDYPNRIVFIRDGMMIKEFSPGVRGLPNNISGIIYCDDSFGNEILGKMEPPAHNDFVPHLLTRKSAFSKKDGDLILKQIDEARIKCVRKIKEKYNASTSNVALVDEIISGISGAASNGSRTGKASPTNEEAFDIIKKEKNIALTFSSADKNALITNANENETRIDIGLDESNGGKDRNGAGSNGVGLGKGIGTGGVGKTKDNTKRKKEKFLNQVKASFYFSKNNGNVNSYKMIVYSNNDIENTEISFMQYGDGGASAMSSKLLSVSDANGRYSFRFDGRGYVIEGINLKHGIRNIFDIEFEEIEQSAFKFNN